MRSKIEQGQSLKHMESIILQELTGKQLWGDIDLSMEEYEVLRNRISELLHYKDQTIITISKLYPIAMTSLLVFLARYKFNINYWGLLGKELSTSVYGPIEAELGQIARRTFTKYRFDYSDVKNERRVNLEPIFYEAGLPPESSLNDLFYILKYDSHSVFDPQLIIEDLVEMRSYKIRKPMLKFLKHFKGDRALEFIIEVREAMICVDQNMTSDSQYIGNYTVWKAQEKTKENISSRKKQEFQTKPYLAFDNGKKGLCVVLPRVLLKDEWIEEVAWSITSNDASIKIKRKLNIFGDEGKRYVEPIMLPISPSTNYKIELIDEENLDNNDKILAWTVDGISPESFLMFNANGRLISPTYIPDPFGIIVLGKNISIADSNNVVIQTQDYPTNRVDYSVKSFESTGNNSVMIIVSPLKKTTLYTRPRISMDFLGKTLFSLEGSDNYRLYTEIPQLIIKTDQNSIVNGMTLHAGDRIYPIDQMFTKGEARIDLRKITGLTFNRYGTYSIRLYQHEHFMKMTEFTYVPNIESDYTSNITWRPSANKTERVTYKFRRYPDIQMEFDECKVYTDNDNYIVSIPLGVGTVCVKIKYGSDSGSFSTMVELPIRPFEFKIIDSEGNYKESYSGRIVRIDIEEIQDKDLWINLRFLGKYKINNYKIILRSVNGIEQEETLLLTQSGSVNKNLSAFYDTLMTCPLPARIELLRENNYDETITLLGVSDKLQFSKRPIYTSTGYIVISILDKERNLTVSSFNNPELNLHLAYDKSLIGKTGKTRGYKCPIALAEGFYVVEATGEGSMFDFEDENSAWLTNGNDTIYVSNREKDAPIETFSDWIDQLIRDILRAGISNDIKTNVSYIMLGSIDQFKGIDILSFDCERLIALAYFVIAKCSNNKREYIIDCMKYISMLVLNAKSRLNIIRTLASLQCPADIFEICMDYYDLLLCSAGSKDAIQLAEQIETHSTELSLLLRMGADDTIRNTIGREKFRELIGKEALRNMLFVPCEEDQKVIIEEQRKFLREQASTVKIRLTSDISGEMEPITNNMVKVTYNKILFDKSAKPDIGIYFDRIRYVDQYVNWYFSHATNSEGISEKTRRDMCDVVKEYAQGIIRSIDELERNLEIKGAVKQYNNALKARYKENPLSNLSAAIPARYFYLQGLAALLARLPKEYYKYEYLVRTGETFMVKAFNIAPRMARRDILMASVYIYLIRKEVLLCQ